VRRCRVSIFGKDGETHTTELDATSLFEAADTLIRDFSRLWWWSSTATIEIQSGLDRWQVDQAKVRELRKKKRA
jgi:hypothetical protein